MILPNNGKIVIIDDEYEEVAPLLKALKKEKMPFLYFEERDGSDLPIDGPIDDIRLVFLDLDLGMGGTNEIEKIRIVQQRIESIIKPDTPYVLVIWSSHEDRYVQTLMEEFDSSFKKYKPIFVCSLDKLKTLKESDVVSVVRAKLRECLDKFEAFNAFLLWESIVNSSAGQVTNNLVSIFERNERWDTNIKNTFYKIAFAELGSELIESYNDKARLKLAIKIINSSLIDCVENDINDGFDKLSIKDIKPGGTGLSQNAIIKLNTNIHLIKSSDLNHYSSGNIYISEQTQAQKENLKELFKDSKLQEIIDSKPKHIQLDITPACDYSKPKGYIRIISGVLYNGNIASCINNKDYIYSQCPIIEIDSPMLMIFDFRSLISYSRSEFEKIFKEKPKVRLRSNILLDIQAQLSNHINRPGIFQL